MKPYLVARARDGIRAEDGAADQGPEVARLLGAKTARLSVWRYKAASSIVRAADERPEEFADLMDSITDTESLHGLYKELLRRRVEQAKLRLATLDTELVHRLRAGIAEEDRVRPLTLSYLSSRMRDGHNARKNGAALAPSGDRPIASAAGAAAAGLPIRTYAAGAALLRAIDADPDTYKDLSHHLAQESTIRKGYEELLHRRPAKPKPARRHPSFAKMRYRNSTRELERAVYQLEGICGVLSGIAPDSVDAELRESIAKSLSESAAILKATSRGLYAKAANRTDAGK